MREKAYSVMLQGCASSVGKSLLTAALCRIIRQDGYTVAPFKSQNMALNSYITLQGHEMGRAQVVQAEAAGIEPDVLMNPILLKPTSEKKSQIIVNGKVFANCDFKEYHAMKAELKPLVQSAYDKLAKEYEYIILEGAGSPAEINLKDNDIVNMGMAEMSDSPVILIGDIDNGGVFAFLAGTLLLMPPEHRARVKAVVINKFRGDVEILKPGLKQLEDIIGIKVLGVVPYMDIDIEDEDSVTDRFNRTVGSGEVEVAVIRLPHISNYTDFNALTLEKSVTMRYVTHAKELGDPDLILIPGTKNTIEDLLYLKSIGLDTEIVRQARRGTNVIGICGGYQMMANILRDPHHVESHVEQIAGLGLLDMEVNFGEKKVTTRVEAEVVGHTGLLDGLTGSRVEGYEIHMGTSRMGSDIRECIRIINSNGEAADRLDGVSNMKGNVFGTYLHGIFDNSSFLHGIINNIRAEKGLAAEAGTSMTFKEYKEREYDRLAEVVRRSIEMDMFYDIVRGKL